MRENSIPINIPEDNKMEVETDLKLFLENFFSSNEYRESFKHFYERKNIEGVVTEEERKHVFNESEDCVQALVKFNTEVVTFEYAPTLDTYSPKIMRAIGDYLAVLKDFKMGRNDMSAVESIVGMGSSDSQDVVMNLDKLRRQSHLTLAEILMEENIVPTKNIGEGMAYLIAYSKGLVAYEEISRSKWDKIKSTT